MKAAAVVLSFGASAFAADCNVPDPSKVDCGYVGINQDQCQAKGCCWVQASGSTPWCFNSNSPTSSCFALSNATTAPFSAAEVSTFTGYYMANINIQGSGAVVAAPDHNTPGGDYYFHWERDGALTMRTLLETQPFTSIQDKMKAYAGWVLKVQNQPDPNGIDVRTEPKYTIPSGVPYTGGWCRPQTDGPGLRGITLLKYATVLIAQGQQDFVKENLWTGTSDKNGGAIKYDLDWVAADWQSEGCDLWEEVKSTDFFWGVYNFKLAMQLGADFAQAMGDTDSATRYSNAAASMIDMVKAHWNGNFVQESTNRPVDGAVIVAFNNGYNEADGIFGPTDPQVAATIKNLIGEVCQQYPINVADTAKGIAGVLLGRYPGDTYAGGNPWILSSGALASLFYRGASVALKQGVAEEAMIHFRPLFNLNNNEMPSNLALSRLFAASADGVLERIRYHIEGDNFHMKEQIDKNSGVQCSANDLTWSYAEVIKAMAFRNQYAQQVAAYVAQH